MLAKKAGTTQTGDFGPIANVRLFYNTCAYIVLHRFERSVDNHQPEKQHSFRRGRRIEEHLLTANLVVDKTWKGNAPLWVAGIIRH